MKRRDLIKGLATGMGAAATGGLLAACDRREAPQTIPVHGEPARDWKMVTSWPRNFPGLGTGAEELATRITQLSGGRIRVRVFAAGELVPALEVFDAVAQGTAEMGHTAAYYWRGKAEAAQFFTSIPFGMNAQETNAWLYRGDGLALYRELYAPFGLVPFPAGNSGVQMGGWFNREIRTPDDLRGLKLRMAGLGGEVLRRAGATIVNLPPGEIFTALQGNVVDAADWVGPYNDLALGLQRAARYYYWPGWQEPSATVECLVNQTAWKSLPEDLKTVVATACEAANQAMLTEFTARNGQALRTLREQHDIQLRRFPDAVLARLRAIADEVLEDLARRDPMTRRIHDSYRSFQQDVTAWHALSEAAIYGVRGGA